MNIRSMVRAAAATVALAVGCVAPSSAVPSDLDPAYAGTGRVVVDGGGSEQVTDVALQRDGSAVVVGTGYDEHSGDGLLFRVRPDGSLDRTLGVVRLGSPGTQEVVQSVVVDSQDRIVVAGWTSLGHDVFVERFLADGRPDGSFGIGGTGVQLVNLGGTELALDVAVTPTDGIVVTGSTDVNGTADLMVLRLTPQGPLDKSFHLDGWIVQKAFYNQVGRSVAVQPDGKVLVTSYEEGAPGLFVYRWGTDGAPDVGFAGGRVVVDHAHTNGARMAVADDGSILVTGVDQGETQAVVARIRPGGLVDEGFGGKEGARFALGGATTISAVAALSGGRVLVTGAVSGPDHRPFVARLDRLGRLDPGFVPRRLDGIAAATGLAVQGDGKVVVSGVVGEPSDDAVLLRLRGDAPEPTEPRPVDAPRCHGRPATIVGTDAADRISGTRGSDVVVALGGNDVVTALAGDDLVCAGSGNDKVKGGAGKDRLYGERGRDRLLGGSGRDRVVGGPQRDEVRS